MDDKNFKILLQLYWFSKTLENPLLHFFKLQTVFDIVYNVYKEKMFTIQTSD